eukprot:6199171-Pleurochrysis_carterae.AAC.5
MHRAWSTVAVRSRKSPIYYKACSGTGHVLARCSPRARMTRYHRAHARRCRALGQDNGRAGTASACA